ncbi:ABC transporter substrate-binding protein [Streptomyces sp. NPDC020917]|uniref:ABC transporter substrate-binding protein n=1 Tax=Streptomyces sp. NPDC020917 TaxID=3365102 RepID=UPI0037A9005A
MKNTLSSPRNIRLAALAVAAVTAAPLLASCSSSSSGSKDPLAAPKAKSGTVVVGSNNFPESILIGDIYGEALKAKGITVSYKPNIGTRETTYKMLQNGSVTVLPEYNGALLAYLDKTATPATVDATATAITAKLDSKLTILNPAPAEDKDSVTVNAATAAKYHLTADSTIADLAKHGDEITFGGSPEFKNRQQGLLGLKSVYGLTPKSYKTLDVGGPLTEAALKNDNVQAADIFSTDVTIAQEKWVSLKDPKNLFGFENVLPLVSKTGLQQNGVDALNAVSAKLTTEALLDMNAQVQNDKKDPLAVAQAWLKSAGLA